MPKPITDSNRLGDIAEHYVVTWLWEQGYEVFLNAGSTGVIDIVAWKDGEFKLIDVKSRGNKKSGVGRQRKPLQKKLGVQIVFYNAETRKIHWVNHNE
jgi:Holliday junction resolvase-like predicted endonuclease